MTFRMLLSLLTAFGLSASAFADAKSDAVAAKVALTDLGEFIGQWNISGEDAKKLVSKEVWTWGWKFEKSGETYMHIEMKDGKIFTKADVKYNVEKKEYIFNATGKDGKAQAFTGKLLRGKFVLERTDSATKDVYKYTISTAAQGIRLVTLYEVQTGGKGLASTIFKATGSKEGESFSGGAKKPECVVTGGAGTMAVSYMGKTYYVCCSGCRDEFNATPKKYVDEFEAKKK